MDELQHSQTISKKQERQMLVLRGLVELYLQTGKPIGSQTLQEHGFGQLSTATIRNYFAELEESGFLMQQHSSGGRLPSDQALRFFVNTWRQLSVSEEVTERFERLFAEEKREVALLLQRAAECLSQEVRASVFLSAPRFDQDAIIDIKLVALDQQRCLCVLLTQFGLVQTEIIRLSIPLTAHFVKRLEAECLSRLTQVESDTQLELAPGEQEVANKLYQELIMRYVGRYAHFYQSDLWRTGLSNLLGFPELNEASSLMQAVGLFENELGLRALLRSIEKERLVSCWIGEDLRPFFGSVTECAVVGVAYEVNHLPVGAIGCLAAKRMHYPGILPLLQLFAERLSQTLTRNMYTFKVQYRQEKAPTFLTNPFPLLLAKGKL